MGKGNFTQKCKRLHPAVGYMSPAEFGTQLAQQAA